MKLRSSGRERCFGKYHVEDRMCEECPRDIKGMCVEKAGVQLERRDDRELQELKRLVMGT